MERARKLLLYLMLKSCLLLGLLLSPSLCTQAPGNNTVTREPSLPVVDYQACSFEDCSFRKWVVNGHMVEGAMEERIRLDFHHRKRDFRLFA